MRALGAEGYEVLEAGNGQEALELLDRRGDRIRLVVSDIAMPIVDGRGLRAQLAHLRAGLPVLLMSGFPHDDLLRRGMIEPGEEFLQKPFAPTDLARKVRAILDRADQRPD